MTTRKKVTIKRSQWLRGDFEQSFMCNSVGHMCCLGFAANQLYNIDQNDLTLKPEPSDVDTHLYNDQNILVTKSVYEDDYSGVIEYVECAIGTKFSIKAMDINDDRSIKESEREAKLIDLFAEYDVDLEFVD